MTGRPRVCVSACLLGRAVRWDGGHRLNRALVEALGRVAELVAVCPEEEAGLGVPREPMRLVGEAGASRLVTLETGIDLTARMEAWCRRRLDELAGLRLAGFVLKARSPSCAVRSAEIFPAGGGSPVRGPGVFARLLAERLPLVPVEEDSVLADDSGRREFLARVIGRAQSTSTAPK
jgi:uncharacterized protein YbbK (DUF523 family)